MKGKNQNTLAKSCYFEGKGLHTGKVAGMEICPAEAGFGIRFRRTDVGSGAYVEAVAENVSNTARSTTISENGVSVITIEHLMSAMSGLGIDNALINIDGPEVPILDGSAKPYIDAILGGGVRDLGVARKYIDVPERIEIVDEQKGSRVVVEPADRPSFEVMVDFNSKVLGVQHASWDESIDYATQIGVCRTFVFFHEIEYLFNNNLVKGGDVDNAIVIVEHPVSQEQLDRMAHLFNVRNVGVRSNGYLSNIDLHFDNECARHKLLDLIGDFRLAGGYLNAKVSGFKAGHGINTRTVKAVRDLIR